MKRPKKASNKKIDQSFLEARVAYAEKLGFKKQKWVEFCEIMLKHGFHLELYEAKRTVSKYITVSNRIATFKVRFSNHAPIKTREVAGDCDFFVGKTHLGITNTSQAVEAVLKHFASKSEAA